MEETLRALSGILLRAIPTFLLVMLLHFFLKYSFFGPLERILKARYDATEGARQLAKEMVAKAAARDAEFEAAMRTARAEVYQAQEQLHRQLEEQHKAEIQAGRAAAEQFIRQAKAELAADVERARQELARESEALAARIADAILSRSAA
jgi:F-type H+-transporting ATPase subunit b